MEENAWRISFFVYTASNKIQAYAFVNICRVFYWQNVSKLRFLSTDVYGQSKYKTSRRQDDGRETQREKLCHDFGFHTWCNVKFSSLFTTKKKKRFNCIRKFFVCTLIYVFGLEGNSNRSAKDSTRALLKGNINIISPSSDPLLSPKAEGEIQNRNNECLLICICQWQDEKSAWILLAPVLLNGHLVVLRLVILMIKYLHSWK